jgi:spore maturation protein CgeB
MTELLNVSEMSEEILLNTFIETVSRSIFSEKIKPMEKRLIEIFGKKIVNEIFQEVSSEEISSVKIEKLKKEALFIIDKGESKKKISKWNIPTGEEQGVFKVMTSSITIKET